MYTEFWFCGILFSIVFWLVGRECYLFVKLKVEEWNIQVYERILREEMMLRLSIEVIIPGIQGGNVLYQLICCSYKHKEVVYDMSQPLVGHSTPYLAIQSSPTQTPIGSV
ncbi:uncharacterized protein LOC108158528 isoform X15 [Drosophila miranda]|uniref:uncharacterized protein LOC108158528 isoform X15 n=1 Tax=Drosophila miranda TaxID=7229 RepID=UPI0007E76737|nr:uncharacterized protein LOC108158528 isoform X15 [Drosophila miranda]